MGSSEMRDKEEECQELSEKEIELAIETMRRRKRIRKVREEVGDQTAPCRKKRRRRKYEVGGGASKRSYDDDGPEMRSTKRMRKMAAIEDDLDPDEGGCGMTKANIVDADVCDKANLNCLDPEADECGKTKANVVNALVCGKAGSVMAGGILDDVECDDLNCEEKVAIEELAQSREEGQLLDNFMMRESGPASTKINKQTAENPETIGKCKTISSPSTPLEINFKTAFKFTARRLDDPKKTKLRNFTDVMMEKSKIKANQPSSLKMKRKRKTLLPPSFSHRTMKDYFKPTSDSLN